MRCQAKNRQGKQCGKSAVPGKRVCRLHGGASPGGPDSATFKHGRYSKYLPTGLLKKYEEARKDPDLLNLNNEISLIDVRLKSLIEKLPEGGASHSWVDLKKAFREFIAEQEGITPTAKYGKVLDIINEGAQEAEVWLSIESAVQTRRKLAATEAKRLIDMQQTVTAEKAMAFAYAVLDINRRHILAMVLDRVLQAKLLTAISEDLRAAVSLPARQLESHDQ